MPEPKRRNASKAVERSNSTPTGEETEVARLARALNEAREQQTATSEVLQVISSFAVELDPVFQAIVTNATRSARPSTQICTFLPMARFSLFPLRLHWSACAAPQFNRHPERASVV